jgi:hypothetical protein
MSETVIVIQEPLEVVVISDGGASEIVRIVNEIVEVVEIFHGPPGADGGGGMLAPIPFAFNNTSPRVVYTLPAQSLIRSVTLVITIAFDGAGASLAVGTPESPNLLIAPADNNPGVAIDYEIDSYEVLPAETEIQITTNPGAGAGAGAGYLILDLVAI